MKKNYLSKISFAKNNFKNLNHLLLGLCFLLSSNLLIAQVVITSNTSWDPLALPPTGVGNDYRQGITVKDGAILEIKNITLNFAPNKEVLVESGGFLTINGVTLKTLNNNANWKGVKCLGNIHTVNPNGTTEQFLVLPNPGGTSVAHWEGILNTTEITNNEPQTYFRAENSKILNARIAASSDNGAIIRCRKTEFTNCETGVLLQNYESNMNRDVNASYLMDCDFNWNNNIAGFIPENHVGIKLFKVETINIGGCTFVNKKLFRHCPTEAGRGIVSEKSSVSISSSGNSLCSSALDIPGCLTNCYGGIKGKDNLFELLYNGVDFNSTVGKYNDNSENKYTFTIKLSHFENNFKCINIVNTDLTGPTPFKAVINSTSMYSNRREMNLKFLMPTPNPCYSNTTILNMIYIEGTGYDCYKTDLLHEGINSELMIVKDIPTLARIVTSSFTSIGGFTAATDNMFGLVFIGQNPMQKIYCNHFKNLGVDILLKPGATIKFPVTGKVPDLPSYNMFSLVNPYGGRLRIDNSGNPPFVYDIFMYDMESFFMYDPYPPTLSNNVITRRGTTEYYDCVFECKDLMATGIVEKSFYSEKTEVFPNPTNGIIHLKNSFSKMTSIKLYNNMGQLVESFEKINDFYFSINCSIFANGIYTAIINFEDDQIVTQKFIFTQ